MPKEIHPSFHRGSISMRYFETNQLCMAEMMRNVASELSASYNFDLSDTPRSVSPATGRWADRFLAKQFDQEEGDETLLVALQSDPESLADEVARQTQLGKTIKGVGCGKLVTGLQIQGDRYSDIAWKKELEKREIDFIPLRFCTEEKLIE